MMINELKTFVEKRLEEARKHAVDQATVSNYRAIAYGAIRFAEENGLVSWDDISEWLDDYILIEFQRLMEEKEIEWEWNKMSWEKEMQEVMLKIKSICEKNSSWTKCHKCPFNERCDILFAKFGDFPFDWKIEEEKGD